MTFEVIQHPSAENTPLMTIADALARAQAGEMASVCVIYETPDGTMRIACSKQTMKDVAAFSVVLARIASKRLG